MTRALDCRVVLVTGAPRRIGAETARPLADAIARRRRAVYLPRALGRPFGAHSVESGDPP